jgi:hypothetical protein
MCGSSSSRMQLQCTRSKLLLLQQLVVVRDLRLTQMQRQEYVM